MSSRFRTLVAKKPMCIPFWKPFLTVDSVFRRIYINCTKRGTLMTELVVPELLESTVPLPLLPEQRAIGALFRDVDDLITLRQRELEHTKSMKRGLLQKMFPKAGSDAPELRFPGFTDPWEQRKLGDEFAFLRNNTLSRSELSNSPGSMYDVHYGDILVKFGAVIRLDIQALPSIADDESATKLSCDELHNGDVVVADTAEDLAAGKCSELREIGDLRVVGGLHTMPLRPLREYAPCFLGYCLNAPSFRRQLVPLMQGIKVISISRSAMSAALFSAPSLSEQRLIGSLFRDVDGLITLRQRELKLNTQQGASSTRH